MNFWKMSTFALVALFTVTVAAEAVPTADAKVQPVMKSALKSLEKAAKSLEKATADKGGHRVNAMRLTKEAIAEVEAGIAYDNTH